MPQSRTFDVWADGLAPIRDALVALRDAPVDDLHERLNVFLRRPTSALADVLNHSVTRTQSAKAARLEVVLDWLRVSGFAEAAREIEGDINALRDDLRQWESDAIAAMEWRASDCREREREGRPVEAVDRLGIAICERHAALMDHAERVAGELDRLELLLRPPELTPAAEAYLQALAEAGAFDFASRTTHEDVVPLAFGRKADPNCYKRPARLLRENHLIDATSGRGGGCWLTKRGRRVAAVADHA